MNGLRKELRPLTLISLYPFFSTLAMTLIWQATAFYSIPFLGAYYLRWVDLYAVEHPNYWGAELVEQTRLYYAFYFAQLLALVVLSILVLVLSRAKPICAVLLEAIWCADLSFLIVQSVRNGWTVRAGIQAAEHLLYLGFAVFLTWRGFRALSRYPKTKKKKRAYAARFAEVSDPGSENL